MGLRDIMDRREVEIVPGIYITWASGSQESVQPLSPEQYMASLQAQGLLLPPIIDSEKRRLGSLIQKLEETNSELQFDQDCGEYVQENLLVIAKYRRMIRLLDEALGVRDDSVLL